MFTGTPTVSTPEARSTTTRRGLVRDRDSSQTSGSRVRFPAYILSVDRGLFEASTAAWTAAGADATRSSFSAAAPKHGQPGSCHHMTLSCIAHRARESHHRLDFRVARRQVSRQCDAAARTSNGNTGPIDTLLVEEVGIRGVDVTRPVRAARLPRFTAGRPCTALTKPAQVEGEHVDTSADEMTGQVIP